MDEQDSVGERQRAIGNQHDEQSTLEKKDQEMARLQQYIHYAETTKAVSSQRLRSNRFYVSVLSGLLVVFTFVAGRVPSALHSISIGGIGVIGVILCALWKQTIESHRDLNTAKFNVVNRMEEDLPYQVYSEEWDQLQPKDKREKKNPGLKLAISLVWNLFSRSEKVGYREQTNVELTIANVIAWAFVLIIMYGLFSATELIFL